MGINLKDITVPELSYSNSSLAETLAGQIARNYDDKIRQLVEAKFPETKDMELSELVEFLKEKNLILESSEPEYIHHKDSIEIITRRMRLWTREEFEMVHGESIDSVAARYMHKENHNEWD